MRIVAVLAVAASAATAALASGSAPTAAGFRASWPPAEIEVCYNGLGSEDAWLSRDAPYRVSLRIVNVYRRSGQSKVYRSSRTYRGDLAWLGIIDRGGDTYGIQSGYDFPCETVIELETPFLLPEKTAVQTGTLYLTVRAPGKRPGSAAFRYRIRHQPGEIIREGSDAFWNYCVTQHPERVRSSGGQLYCWTDDDVSISVSRAKQ